MVFVSVVFVFLFKGLSFSSKGGVPNLPKVGDSFYFDNKIL